MISSFLGSRATAVGDIAVTDERKLLSTLAERCREAGVTIQEQAELIAIAWADDVTLNTSSGALRARLVVDCTGGLSPIASTFRLHRTTGFFTIYGALVSGVPASPDEFTLASVTRLGYPPVFLEFVPIGREGVLCVVFTATRRAVGFEVLRDALALHVRDHGGAVDHTRAKHGIIPIGTLRRRHLPSVVAFGEAAMLQPPLLGSAFNETLEHAENVAVQIRDMLTTGATRAAIRYPLAKRLNDSLQRLFVNALIDAPVARFDALVRLVARLPPEDLFRLYSNELQPLQALRIGARLGVGALRGVRTRQPG